MKPIRLAGASLIAVLAIGLLSATDASAASSNPLFLAAGGGNPVGTTVVGLSGPSTLTVTGGGQEITCQKDTATGTITSTLLLGKVFVHYLECTILAEDGEAGTTKVGSVKCTIKSVGAEGEGLILTKELHGILGLILSPAPLDTGILFLPTSGKVFVEFPEATKGTVKCSVATKVSGSVAGLLTPVAVDSFTGLLVFPKEPIKKIDLTHGRGFVEPELVGFFGTSLALSQHDFLEWSEKIGVT